MAAASRSRWRLKGKKWPIVVAICLGVVGLVLFIAQDPRTLRVESRLAVDDPAFPDYLASLVDAPVTRGDAYEVLQNGDQIYPPMLAAMAQARRRIEFETYSFTYDDVGKQFVDAWIEAARRGVAVRVVLDAFGATGASRATRQRLADAGVQLKWFNAAGFWTIEATNHRTHRKILVVDGELAFTGGSGVGEAWLGNARNEKEWRDTHFAVRGPAVRLFEACFFENWVEAGGEGAPELDLTDRPGPGDARSLAVWSNPIGGVSNVKLLFLYSIAAARRTIDIQSPYFIPDGSARTALQAARERGVRVRVLTDGLITDAKSVKHASRDTYRWLLADGIEIHEYEPTMMHAKTMVVDGRWSVFGSGNFDNRSLELNDEITIGVADAGVSTLLTQAFEADLQRSKAWTAETWRQRPWHWKLRERFWGLFGEVF